jgi:NADH:ubiquinone oxidoreductase subunit 6 (subunit J)
MKSKIWNILVLTVLALSVVSFLVLFEENKVEPKLANVPFAFWTGFLITLVIVILTFLASRNFPHQESDKK